MKRMLAVPVAALGLLGCGGDNANEQVVELPNRQACEVIAEASNMEDQEERDASFAQALELAEGDLVAPMAFIVDFTNKNPGFFEKNEESTTESTDSLEEMGSMLADLNTIGPVIEAFTNITAVCARAGVALPK